MPKGVYARNPELRPQTFKNCLHCENKFGPVKRLAVKYCSRECKKKSQKGQASKLKGRSRPNLYRARVGNCLTCGAEYRAVGDFAGKAQVYCSHRCYLKNRRVSLFEVSVMDHLQSRGVKIDRSYKAGRWTFDGRISETKILIEADGCFWHSSPEVISRDARKDVWCKESGYELFRVKEKEYHRDPEKTCDVIIKRWENLTGEKAVLDGQQASLEAVR